MSLALNSKVVLVLNLVLVVQSKARYYFVTRRRWNYQISCFTSAFRSHFPTVSPMLLLLVKNGNSVLFGFILSSEQFEVNIKLTH